MSECQEEISSSCTKIPEDSRFGWYFAFSYTKIQAGNHFSLFHVQLRFALICNKATWDILTMVVIDDTKIPEGNLTGQLNAFFGTKILVDTDWTMLQKLTPRNQIAEELLLLA